jgi:molybdopterin-guanine dinucleotide biosynthesis protein A
LKDFGTAVILCGGKSSRMGFDKCKIKIKDKFLMEIIGGRLEEVFEDVILLSNDESKFRDMKYRVVEDIIPNAGPMGAIYSALKHASSRYVFVTACDMPVININFIKYMMELVKDNNVEGVVSYRAGYVEPLYAFYSKSMIDRFESHINNGSFKLLEVIKSSRMHYIEENDVKRFSGNMNIFTNLNYKSDLAALEEIFEGERIVNE